ncbi:helix-turn-helix domain-containing protein [Pseudonocardiaceae bacterium YIM PH 21723]|nr:helix-turn-helix domain-containing protein [Pseudonocardiaceae bacterium YIM PH 21723]
MISGVGPRLRALRTDRGLSLTALSAATGIGKSTLSRLESGQRKPTLELLLPISLTYQVPLAELVGAPEVGDPRVRLAPKMMHGHPAIPLTTEAGPLQAFKMVLPADRIHPDPKMHEGYMWLYVLSGRMRLILGPHDVVLGAGEVAEFDTHLRHWFGSTGDGAVEFLALFGRQGERIRVRG